mmetsp:Transcript_46942/g.95985  ORF Transcript_46942/g.95985 Transcript_46942/m.95985 type:complete len:147 (-) Transcript_46942:167-607(-)
MRGASKVLHKTTSEPCLGEVACAEAKPGSGEGEKIDSTSSQSNYYQCQRRCRSSDAPRPGDEATDAGATNKKTKMSGEFGAWHSEIRRRKRLSKDEIDFLSVAFQNTDWTNDESTEPKRAGTANPGVSESDEHEGTEKPSLTEPRG